MGDHQFHRGYCLLLLKEHVRELHELESAVFVALSRELHAAGRAVAETFRPWKMNYACYGNVDPHIHWRLFPRYGSEPDHLSHPWLHAPKFKDHLIDAEEEFFKENHRRMPRVMLRHAIGKFPEEKRRHYLKGEV